MATHGSASSTASGRPKRRPLSDLTNATLPAPNLRPHRRPIRSPEDGSLRCSSSIGSCTPTGVKDVYSGTYGGGADLEKRWVEQRGIGKSAVKKEKQGVVRKRIEQLESLVQESASRWKAMTSDVRSQSARDKYTRESMLSDDYFEKQRAYFQEIDAFELAVEVVSDSETE